MKRRTWILSALGTTGALVVGWGVLPARSRMGSATSMLPSAGDVALNGWIKIAQNGQVILAMPRSEMGQGVHTGLSMLVAEELDIPLGRITLETAGPDKIYGNVAMFLGALPFHPKDLDAQDPSATVLVSEWVVGKVARELGLSVTGGSSSLTDAWEPMRMVAASARASLLGAAAAQWGVPVAELSVQDGVVQHASGKHAHFGELAGAAAGTAPQSVQPKDRMDWKLIGQATQRLDIPAKTNGRAQFGLDVRLPDMLFASVVMCPMLGGRATAIDAKAALAMPGVEKCVPLETANSDATLAGATAGFAVVGRTTWHARMAAQQVQVQWQQRSAGPLDSARIHQALTTSLASESGHVFYETGDTAQAEAQAARLVGASYNAPYLAHATMEPQNCTARVVGGRVEVWAPTQVPSAARAVAARVAGVDVEQVTLHVTLLGGGFGRRLEVDFVAQAVKVAMACDGRPVQLTWSREQDMTHDFYRPMHVAQFQAAVDAQGVISSLSIKSAGDAISPRWMARTLPALSGPIDTPDKTASEGLFDLPYGFANQTISHVATRSGVPVGFWRSVGHSHNAFFSESFVDEMALETRQDPLDFRRNWLKDAPRHLAVLNLAAEKSGWGKPLAAGHARGIALHESFNSIVAEVVEASLQDAQIRVHRVVVAVDCGTVINPQSVAQQMEGAVIFGLTAALYSRIDIRDGVVQQSNFPNYPMVTLAQAPHVETHLVPSDRPPGGVGEPGVPPLAPALANALFVLTKKRCRSLPLEL